MAAIFPPSDKGGVPPGPNVVNGYTPISAVIGEGPLYSSNDCTTMLTTDQLNAMVSEILAAVDKLGFAFNTDRLTNLGDAILSALDLRVDRSGDSMSGALVLPGDPANDNEAATKHYVDQGDAAFKDYVDTQDAALAASLTTAYQAADQLLDDNKVERGGDTMIGPLLLANDPASPTEAATKHYVDQAIANLAPSGKQPVWVDGTEAMQAQLTLLGDPVLPHDAADRAYVDTTAAAASSAAAAAILAVRYDVQNLTEYPQRQQGRQNIAAAPFDAQAFNGIQINGAFEVNQPGALDGAFVCDGWSTSKVGTVVISPSTILAPGNIAGCSYWMNFTVTTPQAALGAGDYVMLQQRIEGYRSARLDWGYGLGKPITIGFWSFHHRPGIYSVAVRNSVSSRSYVTTYTQSVADNVEWHTLTIPPDVAGTASVWLRDANAGLVITFAVASGPTYIAPAANAWSAGNYLAAPGQVNGVAASTDIFRIAGVVVLPGNEVIPSERAPYLMRPYDQELRLCQRYYAKGFGRHSAYSTVNENLVFKVSFPAPMRATPTVGLPSASSSNVNAQGITSPIDNMGVCIYGTAATSGLTNVNVVWTADARL